MTQPVQISNIDGDLVLPLGDLLTGCFPRAGLPAEEALSSNYLGYGLSAILLPDYPAVASTVAIR